MDNQYGNTGYIGYDPGDQYLGSDSYGSNTIGPNSYSSRRHNHGFGTFDQSNTGAHLGHDEIRYGDYAGYPDFSSHGDISSIFLNWPRPNSLTLQ
jgi:hypothetical protein